MSFVIYTAGGDAVDLGATMEVLQAFGRFGELERGREFAHLHGVAQSAGETYPPDALAAVGDDAGRFLVHHGEKLTEFERGLLRQLAAGGSSSRRAATTEPAPWLEPSAVRPLTGGERFSGAELTVGDFWSFAFSDLRSNVVRGVLAEFLVARALGAMQSVRRSWDDFDVLTPTGIRVEVKTSAYLQSWAQRKLSTIRFTGLTGRTWDERAGFGDEREVRADVFVFAVQTCREPDDYDPLDVNQWEFYVVPAATVQASGYRSVSLSTLRSWGAEAIGWTQLGQAVGRHARSQAPTP